MYSGRIVGYSISDRMKVRLAVNALTSTVMRRGTVAGCVVHSDRGSQGGPNRLSQLLGHGGVRWHDVSSRQTGLYDRRCVRPAGRSRRGRSSACSGG